MIGLISDTHGLLRKEVVNNLNDCNLIIHAGDVGKFEVIQNLNKISDVEFIKGNCDKDKNIVNTHKIIEVYNKKIYLIHDISKINIDLQKENIDIVVYGHSHKSSIHIENDILYINPGSVGPRRFKLPISMAKINILMDDKYCDKLTLIDKNIYRYKCYEVEFINIDI